MSDCTAAVFCDDEGRIWISHKGDTFGYTADKWRDVCKAAKLW